MRGRFAKRSTFPLHQVNFTAEYQQRVFHYFLDEYRAGRTPNPDILCNTEIKFRAFLDHARRLGAEAIATGHYVRLRQARRSPAVAQRPRSRQGSKLFSVRTRSVPTGQRAVSHRRSTKAGGAGTRRRAGLVTHAKKDSTGICFIGERRFREFLNRYLPAQPGPIHTVRGRMAGRTHRPDVPHHRPAARDWASAVVGRAAANPGTSPARIWRSNTLIVAQGHDHPALFHRRLRASQLHWIAGQPPVLPLRLSGQNPLPPADQPCVLEMLDDGGADGPLWRTAAGHHPWSVGRLLSGRRMPGRRNHRCRLRLNPFLSATPISLPHAPNRS